MKSTARSRRSQPRSRKRWRMSAASPTRPMRPSPGLAASSDRSNPWPANVVKTSDLANRAVAPAIVNVGRDLTGITAGIRRLVDRRATRRRPGESLMADDEASGSGFVTGCSLGVLAGATLGDDCFAANRGRNTRRALRAKVREAADRARDTAGEVGDSVGGQTNELLERGRAIVERARARVDEAVAEGMEAAAATTQRTREPNVGETVDIKVNVRESEGDAYVVDLTGEIDVYTSPKVKDAITELIDQRTLQPRDQSRKGSLHRLDRAWAC